MRTTPPLGRLVLATLMSGVLLLSACGDDDDDATDRPIEAAETTTEDDGGDAGDTTEASDDGDTVEVELVDYGFEGLPTSVPAGTTLSVTNSSTVEFHELVAFRLPDDEERSADELVALPEDELGALFGGPPATVLLAGPHGGEQTAAVGDGTLTEPGRYLILCNIPVGADPEVLQESLESGDEGPPPEDPNAGPPHFNEGMYAEITVE